MAKTGPRKIQTYSVEFKLKAVKLSHQPGVQVKDVAESLCIHPFMLSRWRKEARDGVLVGTAPKIDTEAVAELQRLQDVERTSAGARPPKKSHSVCFGSKAQVFAFIQANRQTLSVQVMCQRYGVSRSGFYARQKRALCARHGSDAAMIELITLAHTRSGHRYGSPRITKALRQAGHVVGRGRVARLMRKVALQGRGNHLFRRKGKTLEFFSAVDNVVRGQDIQRVNQFWVGDVTYLKVAGQWRYLAVVMDRFSRRIIGWALGKRRTAALTIAALQRAIRLRKPPSGVFFHSDRGVEYGSRLYKQALSKHSFDQDPPLRQSLRSYFSFYNQDRLHSSLAYQPPGVFEKSHLTLTVH